MTINDLIKQYDTQNQIEVLKNSYGQIEFAWDNKFDVSRMKDFKYSAILLTGLGGSAIAGDILQNFLSDELKTPFVINRSYSLPQFINENSLVIVSSYSGNTEETISVLNEALKRKCKIICVGSGGKIKQISEENNLPYITVKGSYQPRFALYISFFTVLKIFQQLNLIEPKDKLVSSILNLLKDKTAEYLKEENISIETAKSLIGFIPVIYAGDIISSVGYRFKCQVNENSKLNAFSNVIPEMNHNEIIGWESYLDKQFNAKVVNLIDKDYHPQVSKRFLVTSELIRNAGVEIINLESKEDDFRVRMFDLIYLCDWISYYLAVLRGFDPITIKNINTLKERLANP
ncbi:MAG: bifunctional phosphoglucose/phosphomannose isomerase [Ignavibacteriales bacterium]|nr:MAG: bifunctional phosphoglucose/phosphomannose isomerase [Ignavibacteriales bacterium]